MKKILVVTHEASRTGAPINLVHFLRWIAEERDVRLLTIVLRAGPLQRQFEEVGSVRIFGRTLLDKVLRGLERYLALYGTERASRRVRAIRLRLLLMGADRDVDLVYVNSVSSAEILLFLPRDLPVVVHVHELDTALNSMTPEVASALIERPDRWIAASEAVRDALTRLGCDRDRVSLHYEFTDVQEVTKRGDTELAARRQSLGIRANSPVVLGSGTPGWRKGSDLFLQLAGEVERRSTDEIHFVWVGGDPLSEGWIQLNTELRQLGSNRIHLIPETEDRFDWFRMASVFALTSREDPFPLVALEHGALGVPLLTYRNGGVVELLSAAGSEAAKGIIDYLDVRAFADRVIELTQSEDRRLRAGAELRSRVREKHDVGVVAPILYAELERVCEERRRT